MFTPSWARLSSFLIYSFLGIAGWKLFRKSTESGVEFAPIVHESSDTSSTDSEGRWKTDAEKAGTGENSDSIESALEKRKIENLKARLRQTEEELKVAREGRVENSDTTDQKILGEKNQAIAQLNQAQDELSRSVDLIADLRKELEQSKAREADAQELAARFKALSVENRKLNQMLTQSTEESEKSIQSVVRMHENEGLLQSELLSSQEQVAQLNLDLVELRAKLIESEAQPEGQESELLLASENEVENLKLKLIDQQEANKSNRAKSEALARQLDEQLIQFDSENKSHSTEKEKLLKSHSESQSELVELQSQLANLQAELERAQSESVQANEEASHTKNDFSAITSELSEAKEKHQSSLDELDATRNELNAVRGQLTTAENECSAATEKLALAEQQTHEKEEAVNAGRIELDTSQGTVNELRVALTQSEKVAKKLEREHQSVLDDLDLAGRENNRLEKQVGHFHELQSESKKLRSELELAQAESAKFHENLLLAENNFSTATRELTDANELFRLSQDELETVRNELNTATDKLATSENECAIALERLSSADHELGQRDDSKNTLHVEFDENRKLVEEFRDEMARAKETEVRLIGESRSILAELDLAGGENNRLETQIVLLQTQLSNSATQTEFTNLQAELSRLQTELEQVQSDSAQAKEKASLAENGLSESTQALADTNEKFQRTRDELEAVRNELSLVKELLETSEKEMRHSTVQTQQKNEAIVSEGLEADVNSSFVCQLRDDLANTIDEVEKLKEEGNSILADLDLAGSENNQLESEIGRLQAQLSKSASQSEFSNLKFELTQLRSELEQVRSDSVQAKNNSSVAEKGLSEATRSLAETNEEFEFVRDELDTAHRELRLLKDKLEAFDKEKSNSTKQSQEKEKYVVGEQLNIGANSIVVAQLREDLAAAKNEARKSQQESQSILADLDLAGSENNRLESQLQRVMAQLSLSDAQVSKFDESQKNYGDHEQQLKELLAEVERLQSESKKLRAELEGLRGGDTESNRKEESEDSTSQVQQEANLESEKELQLKTQVTQLESQLETLTASRVAQSKQMESELAVLLSEKDQLHIEVQSLQKLNAEFKDLLGGLESEQERFEAEQVESQQIRDKLASANSDMQNALDTLVHQKNELQIQLAGFSNDNQSADGLQNLTDERDRDKSKSGETVSRFEELKLRYESSQTDLLELQIYYQGLEQQCLDSETRCAEMESRLEIMRSAMRSGNVDSVPNEDLQLVVEGLRIQLDDSHEKFRKFAIQYRKTRSRYKRYKARMVEYKSLLEQYRQTTGLTPTMLDPYKSDGLDENEVSSI